MKKFNNIKQMTKQEKGAYAEALAAHIYEKRYRHQILNRNLRFKGGELDLLTVYNGIFHLVEVKSITSNSYGEAILRWKKQQFRKLAKVLKILVTQSHIKDPDKVCIDFIVFDFSHEDKVRFRRYPNLPLRI